MYISVDQLDNSASRAPVPILNDVKERKEHKKVQVVTRDLAEEGLTAPSGGEPQPTDTNLEKRKKMLAAVAPEPIEFAYERVIGNNDSVYSNFIDLIESAKRKVGRIAVKEGVRNTAYATGFMVSSRLLLTNWHVFRTKEEVGDSEVEFFYEYDTEGHPGSPTCYKLDAETFFFSSEELDYCFIAVSPTDSTGRHGLEEIGALYLDPSVGKLGDEIEEMLNIIHHPDGDYKQLSIRENKFIKMLPSTIWYETDTAPGSSGSPVFNDQWQVVALHHMGVAKKNEAGQYVDKDDQPLPVVNGNIDASKVVWIANEGIRVSVLLVDVLSKFPDNPLVKDLRNPPVPAARSGAGSDAAGAEAVAAGKKNLKTENDHHMESDNEVRISFPASLMEASGSIQINITSGKTSVAAVAGPTAAGGAAGAGTAVVPAVGVGVTKVGVGEVSLDAAEAKKLEDTIDFSQCKGYQPNFLGSGTKSIPMPQPQAALTKFAAKIQGGGGIVLKYFNYSTIFHSVRMVPMISAINVAGDPDDRQDKATRKDNWLRDRRISMDIQLTDEYYSKSGFDKGHMSRREDADWGDTAEDAKRNADLTCMYTNACPQVGKINRSSSGGLWGKLEKIVLEKGVEKEPDKTSKAIIFNGPIFQENDPVFKGIQVAMDFFKIVVWVADNGDLKATAFRLSQQKLVSDIDFEEIDIDHNTEFKPFQVSIQALQDDTKIDFSGIIKLDTFDGEAKEVTTESVKAHVAKQNAVPKG